MSFHVSLGQSKNGNQEGELSSQARGNPIHGLLRQECHRGVQESQTLQEYPTSGYNFIPQPSEPSELSYFLSLVCSCFLWFPLTFSVWFLLLHFNHSPAPSSPSHFSIWCVIVSWLCGTPQWAAGDVWAQPGEDGGYICRHQCLHAAHDVPGHGCMSLHAGLGRSNELRREDCSALQVNWFVRTQGSRYYRYYDRYHPSDNHWQIWSSVDKLRGWFINEEPIEKWSDFIRHHIVTKLTPTNAFILSYIILVSALFHCFIHSIWLC